MYYNKKQTQSWGEFQMQPGLKTPFLNTLCQVFLPAILRNKWYLLFSLSYWWENWNLEMLRILLSHSSQGLRSGFALWAENTKPMSLTPSSLLLCFVWFFFSCLRVSPPGLHQHIPLYILLYSFDVSTFQIPGYHFFTVFYCVCVFPPGYKLVFSFLVSDHTFLVFSSFPFVCCFL